MLYYTLTSEFKTDSDDFEKYDKPNTLTIKVGNLPDILKWSSENVGLLYQSIMQLSLPEGYTINRSSIIGNDDHIAFQFRFTDNGTVKQMKNDFIEVYTAVQKAIAKVAYIKLDYFYYENLSGNYDKVTVNIHRHTFPCNNEPLHCVDMYFMKKAFDIMKHSLKAPEDMLLWNTVWHNENNEVLFTKRGGFRDYQILLYTGAIYIKMMKESGIDV